DAHAILLSARRRVRAAFRPHRIRAVLRGADVAVLPGARAVHPALLARVADWMEPAALGPGPRSARRARRARRRRGGNHRVLPNRVPGAPAAPARPSARDAAAAE